MLMSKTHSEDFKQSIDLSNFQCFLYAFITYQLPDTRPWLTWPLNLFLHGASFQVKSWWLCGRILISKSTKLITCEGRTSRTKMYLVIPYLKSSWSITFYYVDCEVKIWNKQKQKWLNIGNHNK